MTSEQINEAIEQLRELGVDGRITNADIINAVFSGNNYKVRDALIDILKQSNPDTHIELPRDKDGVPIHVGDEVCGYDHPSGGVCCHAIINSCVIAVGDMGDYSNSKGWALWNTLDVRHYHKPTVEDVLREYASIVIGVGNSPELDGVLSECAGRIRELMADE